MVNWVAMPALHLQSLVNAVARRPWNIIEELRECLQSMNLNSDYVNGVLANCIHAHPPVSHTHGICTSLARLCVAGMLCFKV